MKQKVLFDCDNTMGLRWKEIDDGLTLFYLLGRDDLDLVGITTTFGNGSLEEVWQATTNLLRYLGREDIILKKRKCRTRASAYRSGRIPGRDGESISR